MIASGVAFGLLRPAVAVAALRSFYVATDGNDGNPGTQAQPWASIDRAFDALLQPGDEVVVAPGTYIGQVWLDVGGNGDTPDGYITLRSVTPGAALIRPPAGAYSTLHVRANYLIVDGFDVVGGDGHAVDVESCHHVKILNCICHDSAGTGIQFNYSEWLTAEGNRCFRNASTNGFQCSGISLYQCRNISGDGSTPGFRAIIRSNMSYQNVTTFAGNNHTDGNGIIIDDFQSTQTSGFPNYTRPTLVENNLCWGNGSKGIQVTWSDFVTVRNNTCWRNNLDNQNPGSWRGELSNAQSSNNTWVNNIGVTDPAVNSNNRAIDNNSYNGYVNQNVVWHNNLTFNGVAGQASVKTDGGNNAPTAADGQSARCRPEICRHRQ